jgi:hypothetical protein
MLSKILFKGSVCYPTFQFKVACAIQHFCLWKCVLSNFSVTLKDISYMCNEDDLTTKLRHKVICAMRMILQLN